MSELLDLLGAWSRGNAQAGASAFDALCASLAGELRATLPQRDAPSFQDLGRELRQRALALVGEGALTVPMREPFWALASRAARVAMVTLAEQDPGALPGVLAAHESTTLLERADPHLGRLAEMQCFGGMPLNEIAAALGLSERALQRDLAKLPRQLGGKAD